jgi:heme/copper-type cytochrome/quinol oxidase subunit 1
MTTIETHAAAPGGSGVAALSSGVAAWASTTDHKRIGRIYVGFGLLGLIATSVLGVVLGLERTSESSDIVDSGALLQVIQAHRVGLVFAGLIPLTLGLSIAVVPLQLGARQIAFPRLALTGCYAWLGGLALTFAALGRNGGLGGGDANAVDLFIAGLGLMIVGLLASSVSVATSVLTTRAPGMTMRRVPLFAWSALISSLGALLALPVLFGALILLFVDHRIGIEANFGGAEGLGSWVGWVFSTPAVVVFAIPAIGVVAELMPVTFKARQPMRGVIFAGIALVGVTALAATTQQYVHDVSLDSDQTFGAFVEDVLPFLVFAGLPVLGLLITMGLGGLTAKQGLARSKPRPTAAFVFAMLGANIVLLGVIANALQAITDLDLYEPAGNVFTSFEEGATLLVVYGATMGVVGGLIFWAPKLWGRTLPEKAAFPLVLPALGGAVLAGVAMCIAGLLGQVGGIPASDAQVQALLDLDYDGSAELWNVIALIGHALMALSVLGVAGLMLKSFTGDGATADADPYGGHTIEWSTSSPAPADNFDVVPTVASATPQFDLRYEGTQP